MELEFLQVKIPELEALPPERREAVLRRCLESEEFARRSRSTRRLCFVATITATVGLVYVFAWSGIARDREWLMGILAVSTLIAGILLMIVSQAWFEVRLAKKMIRAEIQGNRNT